MTPRESEPSVQISLSLPVELVDRVAKRQAKMPGWLITDVVNDAIDEWCNLKEAQWRLKHGENMPERPSGKAGRMPRGRPWRHEAGPTERVSVLAPASRKARFYKVAFREEYPGNFPGRALASALELWLEVNK